jgi:hypothetical protein
MPLDPREFDMFMNQCRIKLPGSSDAGIKAEFYDVVKEFFQDSNAWREDIQFTPNVGTPPVNGDPFISSNQDYPLTSQDGTGGQIIRLISVYDDKGIPVPSVMHNFGTVHLIHPVGTMPANPWVARVVKNVTVPLLRDDIPNAPSWLLRVYSLFLTDGVLGKMMAQPSKSYSNETQSTYHLRRFRSGIATARTAAERENLRGGQEWSYPRGWEGRTQRVSGISTAWPTRAF